MSNTSINETFIIENIEEVLEFSACTAIFSNAIKSCSGNTTINLGENLIVFNGNTLATIISATTFYGDGSNLTGISTQDTFVTGGTYNNGTAVFTNNTGGTFTISGFYTGTTTPFDVFVTGGTYSDGAAVFTNNTGGTFSVSGFSVTTPFTGGTVFGETIFTNGLSANTISATTYLGLPIIHDTFVTGGTYSDGNSLFTNNTGGTFSVSGFSTGYTLTSSAITNTLGYTPYNDTNPNNYISGITSGNVTTALGYTPLSAYTDTFVTGGTYSDGTTIFNNNTGGTFSISGFTTPFTGGTVYGATIFSNGVTANTFSATTYLNLPKIENLITVAKSGGDFTSIKTAVDSISDSSENNRYTIKVKPGVYFENEIDLTNKLYVSIVGEAIQSIVVSPNTQTQNLFKLGFMSEISFMTLQGVGSGYSAILVDDIGNYAQAHKISFNDCDTNVTVLSSTQDTIFFGEYLDYNGSYSFGTKIIASNGFQAYANMENYYNFPSGSGVTIGNRVQGSGATLSVFVGDGQGNGVSGSTNYEIYDYASLNTTTTTSDNWGYCVRNLNIGGPVRFDIDSLSVIDSIIYDVSVEHPDTFGTFNGSSTHTKINTVSPNVYWSFLDTKDGEFEITRKMSVTFIDGTHTDASTLIFEGSTMGLVGGGIITHVSGLTFQISAGFGYLEKTVGLEIYVRHDWDTTQIILSPNTENYIYFNDNLILSTSSNAPDSIHNIILGRVVTDNTGFRFIDLTPYNSSHTSNLLSKFNRDALGPIYATGSFVTQNAIPYHLNISAGDYYFSENNFKPSGGTNVTFTQYLKNGSGWITSATNVVVNGYDNNTGVIAPLPSSAFTKHTLYVVGQGINEKYMLVVGQTSYTTLLEAQGADLPTPPTYFDDAVAPIASIYIKQGLSGITQIQDIRPVIGFKAAGVSASATHANLLGLNSDDHKQYLLVDGSRPMTGNLSIGGNAIVSASTVNGVVVESHAARHKNGGADEIATATPAPSEIPKADAFGKLDGWISDASTSVKGLTRLSQAPASVNIPIAVGVNDPRFLNSISGVTNTTPSLVFTNNSGGTTTISNLNLSSVLATTISATTYFGLPTINLSGYVPYTGATQNLNLGNFNLQTSSGIVIKNFADDNVTVNIFNDEENVGILSIRNPLNNTSVQVLSDRFNFGKNIDYSYWFSPNLTKPSGDYILATIDDIPNLDGYVPYVGARTDVQLGEFGLETSWVYGYARFGTPNGSTTQKQISFRQDGDGVDTSATLSTRFNVNTQGLQFSQDDSAIPFNVNINASSGQFNVQTQNVDNSTSINASNNIVQITAIEGPKDNILNIEAQQTYSKKLLVDDEGFQKPNNALGQFFVKQDTAQYLSFRLDSYGDLEGVSNTRVIANGEEGFDVRCNDNSSNGSLLKLDVNNVFTQVSLSGITSTTRFFSNRTTFNKSIEVTGNILATTYNGYIPYDSTNPAGYVTSSVVNGYLPVASPSFTGLMTGSGTTQTGSTAIGVLDLSQTWNTTGNPIGIKLNVTNTASGANANLMELQVGGVNQFRVSKAGVVTTTQVVATTLSGIGSLSYNGNVYTSTSGNVDLLTINRPFSPTSGNATTNAIIYNATINQTGGASGVTRGLYINPTLTSIFDFRAIESTNGKVILTDTVSAGSGALAGSLLDLKQTWNTTGAPTAIKLNVTDTASNASSLLIDLQVSGSSKFSINKNGGLSATTFNSNITPNVNNALTVGSSSNQYANIFSNVFSANGTGIVRSGTNLIFQVLGGTVEGGRFFNTGNLSIGSALDNGFRLDVVGNTRIQGSLSATSISATTLNGFIPVKTWKSGIDGATVANTLTITPTYTQLIPENTFVAGDVVEILYRATAGAKTSQTNVYVYMNTTPNLSGTPIQVAIFNTTPTGRTVQIERALAVKGTTTKVINPSGANATDTVQSAAMTALTINWTVDQYFVFAIGHTVNDQTMFGDFYRIIKN